MEKLNELFLAICNMSVTAGFTILFLMPVRRFLQKSPKSYSYCLWGIVGFRLVCPLSFSSMFSMFSLDFFRRQSTSGTILTWSVPRAIQGAAETGSGMPGTFPIEGGNTSSVWVESAPEAASGRQAAQAVQEIRQMSLTEILAVLWIVGMLVFLIYQGIGYWKLVKQTKTAVQSEKDVYECDSIPSPFVMGLLRPRIYLPFRMTEKERKYVLMHERYHIKRHDPQVKFAASIILAVYWFHPLVWTAYTLMCRDMEMSCDEKVIQAAGDAVKEDYSRSLLGFATRDRTLAASVLAFGETAIKARVKNVLNMKKHGRAAAVSSIVLCLLAGIIGCGNALPKNEIRRDEEWEGEGEGWANRYEYQVENGFQSFILYKEMYQRGEMEAYQVIGSGTFGENHVERKGDFTVEQTFETPDDTSWASSISVKMPGMDIDFHDKVELAALGYNTMTQSSYLENEKAGCEIKAEEDVVITVWHLGKIDGNIQKRGSSEYMDETTKWDALALNEGTVLYHVVFSEKAEEDLLTEYQVSPLAKKIFAARNPYIGDAPADGRLLGAIGVSRLGDYTTELQTTEEPYAMIVHFKEMPAEAGAFHQKMMEKAALFLGLTENAGRFEWTYPDASGESSEEQVFSCDLETAARLEGIDDIKRLADSEEMLQEILTKEIIYSGIYNGQEEVSVESVQAPDGQVYSHKLILEGRFTNAEEDTKCLVFANREDVSFQDVETYLFGSEAPKEKMYVLFLDPEE